MKRITHHASRITLLALLLLLAACTPPAPTATPPYPVPVASPLPTAVSSRTPQPTVQPTAAQPATTATPQPYPAGAETPAPVPSPAVTREGMDIEPVLAATAVPRLGVAAALGKGLVLCDGRTWQLWWSAAYAVHPAVCPDVQQVPYLVRGDDEPGQPAFEWSRIEATLGNKDHDYWLIYNEPESSYQGDITPEKAVELLHDGLERFLPLAPNAKLIIGGVNGSTCGLHWLEEFVTIYRERYGEIPNVAGWHFHPYVDLWAGANCDQPWQWAFHNTTDIDTLWRGWLQHMTNIKVFMLQYGQPGQEVWFSEFSCLAPLPACQQSTAVLATRTLEWLDTDGRWVNRYAWFTDWSNHWWHWSHLYSIPPGLDGSGGVLSPVGEIYLNHQALPAVPLEIHRRYFPIIGYGGDVAPPAPGGTATPPAYPVPGDLHP